jgi:DNA polymerase (family 10)
MDRFNVAATLRHIGALLELEGAPPFRAQAYAKGAAALESAEDLERLLATHRLTDLPGIGTGLASIISELATSGSSTLLSEIEARLPPGARELAPILGLEPMRKLHQALGIDSLDALEAACVAGKVRYVHGFGDKSEARLLQKIRAHRARGAEMLLADARLVAGDVASFLLEACPEIDDVVPVGAVRRGEELVAVVELLAIGEVAEAEVARHLRAFPRVARLEPDPLTAVLAGGSRLVVWLASPADAGEALLLRTGPPEHAAPILERLPRRARPSEAEVYRDAGLSFVPPELRDAAELARALAGPLVSATDVKGLVHCHTTWSDGKHGIAEMAQAAVARGLRYITITDHSQAAAYANGLDEERLLRQWDEIDRVQATTSIRLLKGIESDILADGALDYPDAILERLDLVIASIHSRHGQSRDEMTRRLVGMMRHPIRKVWGHPLGRLLQRRAPIECDLDRVLATAAETGTVLELNGDPHRMDLPVDLARRARALGIRFVVSVDAHSMAQLGYLDNAVTLARRAALTPAEVINTLPVEGFLHALAPSTSSAPPSK